MSQVLNGGRDLTHSQKALLLKSISVPLTVSLIRTSVGVINEVKAVPK